MSLVINLYGGPGTGKSTTAAHLFAILKQNNHNAEYVQEYVKQWAWENRKPVNYDQFYFFGKQARKEYSLFKNVDVIVSDSPVCLSAYYAQLFGKPEQASLFKEMSKNYYNMVKNDGHEYLHFWLNRTKEYNPKGRFQTEQEAIDIDISMKSMLSEELGISYIVVDADENAAIKIFEAINEKIKI